MVKKLVILSQSEIEYVKTVARKVSDPRAVTGNFSRGLRAIINQHRENEAKKS